MWELDNKGGWVSKNWCFWTVVLEKTLESPWTARRSNQSILKGISPGCSLEELMMKPTLWPPDGKNWLIGKDPDAGKDWKQEEGTTDDKMVGWHHWLNGLEFKQAPEVGDGEGSLVCCSPWGFIESDTTEWLKWTKLNICDAEHLSMCLFAICLFLWRNVYLVLFFFFFFFDWVAYFDHNNFHELFVNSEDHSLVSSILCKYFLFCVWVGFLFCLWIPLYCKNVWI